LAQPHSDMSSPANISVRSSTSYTK